MTAAALVTAITKLRPDPSINMEIVRCLVTTTGDWYVSSLGTIGGVVISGEGHLASASVSGQKITITATGGDYVDLIIWGTA